MSLYVEERTGQGLSPASEYGLSELMALFLAEMPDRIAHMEAVCHRADWARLGRSAQQLAGAASRYGLEQISPLAERLDRAVRSREGEQEVLRCLDELSRLCAA